MSGQPFEPLPPRVFLRTTPATLADLAHRREAGEVPRYARVLIETSGLALPKPLVQAFATHLDDTLEPGELALLATRELALLAAMGSVMLLVIVFPELALWLPRYLVGVYGFDVASAHDADEARAALERLLGRRPTPVRDLLARTLAR